MMNPQRPWRRWAPLLPAAAYYACIFYLSAQSRLPSVPTFHLSDKLYHGLIFAGFGLALLWGLRRVLPSNPSAAWKAAAAIGIWGGILDEVHQLFVPLRLADPADALADAIGLAAALAAALWISRRRHRR
jgi:VanZ family protein